MRAFSTSIKPGLRHPAPGILVITLALVLVCSPLTSSAQQRRFPPDSTSNLQVLPRATPVRDVITTMRQFSIALDVNCTYCHAGNEATPFDQIDFSLDDKRAKYIAREMMRLTTDANRRLDSLPGRNSSAVPVTCMTCHRGVTQPVPLVDLIFRTASESGVDSAARAYRALRQRYYGRAAYDFDVQTLNSAAGRVANQNRFDDAVALVRLNDEFHPGLAAVPNAMGELYLARGDTTAAVKWYRAALQRDSLDQLATTRLRRIGRP